MTKIAVVCGDVTAALNRRPELMQRFVECSETAPLLICPPSEKSHLDDIRAIGFDVIEVENNKQSLNPVSGLSYFKEIRKLLQQHSATDVFAFHLLPIVAAGKACRKLGIRFHGLFAGLGYVFSNESSVKRKLAEFVTVRLLRSSLKNATTVFFQNPDDCQTITSKKVFSPNTNVVVVDGSGVSLDRFQYSEPEVDGKVVFLLVSRILRDKGLPEYYEAARRLKEKWNDQVQVQLLGPFDQNPNAMTKEQINEWHEQGIVEYLGVTEDVRPYLSAMSVFTLPSFYMEGTPKTILESLASGRAIITTNSRGCRETVVDGENGFMIEPKDVDGLFQSMDYFLENRQAIKTMGMASRELAESKYDVRLVNQHMLDCMGLETKGSAS